MYFLLFIEGLYQLLLTFMLLQKNTLGSSSAYGYDINEDGGSDQSKADADSGSDKKGSGSSSSSGSDGQPPWYVFFCRMRTFLVTELTLIIID